MAQEELESGEEPEDEPLEDELLGSELEEDIGQHNFKTLRSLIFEVPFKGDMRNLHGTTSHTSYIHFLSEAAARMDCHAFCFDRENQVPSIFCNQRRQVQIEGAEDWYYVVKGINDWRTKQKAHNNPFHLAINQPEAIVSDAKNDTKGKKKSECKTVCDDDRDAQDEDSSPLETKNQRQIAKEHHCDKCQHACRLLDDGVTHFTYHAQDLSTWAYLCLTVFWSNFPQKQHKATIYEPPAEVLKNIPGAAAVKKLARKSLAKVQAAPNEANSGMGMEGFVRELITGMVVAQQVLVQQTPLRRPRAPSESSQGYSELSSPVRAPAGVTAINHSLDMENWLPAIDAHPVWGRHNSNYASYLESFTKNGVSEASDLVNLEVEKTQEVVGGMVYGLAHRLLMFARADVPSRPSSSQKRRKH
ncbi:hypothetical protein L218DRAFT_1005367 [Marasmius fiardii PR-910]|nr:hypothetical protein L218DRAFT_1005367 [Marasmius fiardii PR-910]